MATFEVVDERFYYCGIVHPKGARFDSLSDKDAETLSMMPRQVKPVERKPKPAQELEMTSVRAEDDGAAATDMPENRERRQRKRYERRDMRPEE